MLNLEKVPSKYFKILIEYMNSINIERRKNIKDEVIKLIEKKDLI